jgi:biotin synthase
MSIAESPRGLAERVIAGHDPLSFEELCALFEARPADPWPLLWEADRVRRHFFGNEVHVCSIVNAKVGGCPEDCGFCSQSAHFKTAVKPDGWVAPETVRHAADEARARGALALGIVTATRGVARGKDLDRVLADVAALRAAGGIEAHASLGLMSEEDLRTLAAAGVTEFNHNLETGRGFFERIVTTHTYDDRIATIRAARAAGMRTCVGGILGMGEEPRHRAELVVTLRELDVDEVPVNFLVSVEGTALQKHEPPRPMEMLLMLAAFRLGLRDKNVFVCAGRHHLGDLMPFIFTAGASGLMVGDFLTTPNRNVDDDLRMLDALGLRVRPCGTRPAAARALAAGAPDPAPAPA